MRITRFVTIPLLVAVAVACRDAAATAPVSSPRVMARKSDGTAVNVAIPAPNGFSSVVLARGSFTDAVDAKFRIKLDRATTVVHVDDPTQMVMARITLVPGGALPWHTHPGPALVTVASGEITIVHAEGCLVRSYPAGSAFMDSGQGHVHVGFNASGVETVVYVTYLDVPVGQSPLVPVENPGC